MSAPLRLGLVGKGPWGRNYERTIAATSGVRLAGVAGRDWRALLDPRALDGVVVATPPRTHAEIALAAIDAGIPVLVEKPFTVDLMQAEAVRDRALARRVPIIVAHTHLFHPAYRALKALLPQQGAIRGIRGEAGATGPFRPDVPVLWDWGAHDVALCLDLMREAPSHAFARVVERRSGGETVEVSLAFSRGISAELRLSNIFPQKVRRLEVACERATLVFQDFVEAQLRVGERVVPVAKEPPLDVVVRGFAAAIAAGRFDAASVELGIAVVRVLAACARGR
jgi:predicted dehydrogenase